jgi:hypothetical protein
VLEPIDDLAFCADLSALGVQCPQSLQNQAPSASCELSSNHLSRTLTRSDQPLGAVQWRRL